MSDQQPVQPEVTVTEQGSVHNVVVAGANSPNRKFVVWRRNWAYSIIGALLLSTVLMFVAFTLLLREGQQSISDLTDQLRQARAEIEENSATAQERETCRLRYTSTITENQARVLIAFSRAVGVEGTDADRARHLAEINRAGDDLEVAIASRAEYEAAGAPLPCPVQ